MTKYLNSWRTNFSGDPMIRKGGVLFCAMMVGNVFGYLFQVSMGRMLSLKEYGEMNALMSLMIIFGIPFQTLINYFAKNTAVFIGKGQTSKIKSFQKSGLRKVITFLLPLFIFMSLLSTKIASLLHLSADQIVLVFSCIFFAAIVALNTGVLQGLQCFYSLACVTSGVHVIRFLFGLLLVWMGMGVYGPIFSMLIAACLLFAFSQWRLNTILPNETKEYDFSLLDAYKYATGLFVANVLFGIMTQSDVLLVKHFFTESDAGLYTASAILGKAVLYLSGAIVLAMFPMVAERNEKGDNSMSMLIKALTITFFLSGSGAMILFFFSEPLITLIYGDKFASAALMCEIFGFAMVPVALSFLLMNYLLARGYTGFVGKMSVVVAMEITMILFFHNAMINVIYAMFFAGIITFFILFFKVYKERKNFSYISA